MEDRIDLGDDGSPDEVVFRDVKTLHMERMDKGHVWVGIDRVDGTRCVSNFYTPRNGRLLWRVEED